MLHLYGFSKKPYSVIAVGADWIRCLLLARQTWWTSLLPALTLELERFLAELMMTRGDGQSVRTKGGEEIMSPRNFF